MGARGRTNLFLFVLALVLGLAALLLPDPQRNRPPPAVAFEPGSIERITYRPARDGEVLELRRGTEGWRLSAPVARAARDGHVNQLLESLRERTDSCYPAADHDPAEFGLDPPRAELELDGITVSFGDRASDGRRYLQARGRLCLVEDIALPLLQGGSDSLTAPDDGGD